MTTGKKGGLLDDFSLNDGEETFFGITPDEKDDNGEELVEKVKSKDLEDEGNKEKKKGKEDTKDEDEDDEWFVDKDEAPKKKVATPKSKTKDEDEDEDEDNTKEKTTVEGTKKESSEEPTEEEEITFTDYAADLKDRGIFSNIEIPKGEEITEDKLFELHEKEIESRVDETFETFFEELGDEGAKFLKYVKEGGSPKKYIAEVTSSFDLDELDEDDDTQVKRTLKYYLVNYEGLEPEDLEDRMSWLKDNGKSKSYAKKYFNQIKKDEKNREEEREEELKQQKTANKERIDRFNNALLSDIEGAEEIAGVSVTKKEQKELAALFTKSTVKIDKNKYVPKFHGKLKKIGNIYY